VALGLGAALLGAGSSLNASPALADSRVLRLVDGPGQRSAIAPPAIGGADESVGSAFNYLAARANGAPQAQVSPTPVAGDSNVRVILAPDARGPLPPAITLPAGQLPASVAASSVSASPVPLPASGPSGAIAGSTLTNTATTPAPNGVAQVNNAITTAGAIPYLANTSSAASVGNSSTRAAANTTAGGQPASGGSGRILPNNPPTATGMRLVGQAQSQLGARYVWAGTSPSTGFDCSGFVYWVFNSAGFSLPRTMEDQFASGRRVRMEDLRAGDIVFFADTYQAGLSHDGIYLGDGRFIHAVDESTGVAITPLSSSYWEQRFVGGVRLAD
jgi:cell wall-associated NlpC family hydrolase